MFFCFIFTLLFPIWLFLADVHFAPRIGILLECFREYTNHFNYTLQVPLEHVTHGMSIESKLR